MIDLDTLAPEPAAPRVKIDPDTLIASPGFAPQEWQTQYIKEQGFRASVPNSPDLARVLALPRRPTPNGARGEALIELMTNRFAKDSGRPCDCAKRRPGRPCITRLRIVQAWALFELGTTGGLLGLIAVGHGKTMIDLLAPLALRGCRTACLLVPPSLVVQLCAEYELLNNHWHLPSLVVQGKGDFCIQPGAPVLHVLPYSRLSNEGCAVFLQDLAPDTIIADECDLLRHATAVRTGRVMTYFSKRPETRFAGWSGSITDKSIREYAHLAALALRAGSPLPLDHNTVTDWASALDPSDWPSPAGALTKLCNPGERVQDGFRRRLLETPGVVSALEAAVDVHLTVTECQAPPVPAAIEEALEGVRATWVRPDGEELIDALTVARCLRELACGFYYRWTFPNGEPEDVIWEWLSARKEWRRELREVLKFRREHLDSPLLCARAAMRAYGEVDHDGTLPVWHSATWPRWRLAKHTVKPVTEPVWIDDYLVRDAARWGHENLGIIWYEHAAFGRLVAELSGLPMHGGGPEAGARIAAEKGDRSIVASLKSHYRGRDGLQLLYRQMLFSNPPSSATVWEQAIGRLVRIGQAAKSVEAQVYVHTPELRAHLQDAIARANYVESTLGSSQKLLRGLDGRGR